MQIGDTRSSADGPVGHLGGLPLARAGELGQRPFLTFADPAGAERTELGWATFENWTAKAANLLVEDLELGAGDVLGIDLGTHWTSLVIVAAAWRAGVTVALPGADAAVDACAHREGREPSGDVPAAVVGAGIGGRLEGASGTAVPFVEDVLAFPDDFGDERGDPDAPVLLDQDGARSSRDLLGAADVLAEAAGLRRGGRYVSVVPVDTAAGLIAGPVVALGRGCHLVLAVGTPGGALAEAVAAEQASALLVPTGAPRPSLDVPVVEVTG